MKTACRYLLLASCITTAVAAQELDHYNPVLLNEYALQKLQEGDVATAKILLERAALLAPENSGIRNNLATLKASIAGERLPFAELLPSESTAGAASDVRSSGASANDAKPAGAILPAPPFPIWQKHSTQ